MTASKAKPKVNDRERVLTQSVLAAAEGLQLRDKDLASVLGVSPSMVTNYRRHGAVLDEGKTPFHLGMAFIRIFRSLAGIVGTKPEHLRGWFHSENRDLGGMPAQLVTTPQGLYLTLQYLDANRAII